MIRSLWTSASGLLAQQLNTDIIADNLANVDTTGFKKASAAFKDLDYQEANPGGLTLPGLSPISSELWVCTGTSLAATQKSFSQGELLLTSQPLDLAVEGGGFFRVVLDDGSYGYTRDGALGINSQGGRLQTSTGYQLYPPITIPSGATSISIATDGTVTAFVPGESDPQELGQIKLYEFVNPAGLSAAGENLFVETVASGTVTEGTPGSGNFGRLVQGYLERSNVDLVEEMTKLITAQRAYELNSRAIRTSEDMLTIANGIRA